MAIDFSSFSDKQILFTSKRDLFRTLMFKGTLDKLAKGLYFGTTKNELREHKIYKGYFKEVKVLNDKGREKLERLRKRYKKD